MFSKVCAATLFWCASLSAAPQLTLYIAPWCTYSNKVLASVENLNIPIEVLDTTDCEVLQELVMQTGSQRIPCLFIDGTPLYESKAIIAYLHSLQETP